MKKFLRFIFILIGIGIGPLIVSIVDDIVKDFGFLAIGEAVRDLYVYLLIYIGAAIISGIIFILLSKRFSEWAYAKVKRIEEILTMQPAAVVLFGIGGLVLGLVVAFLISQLFGTIGSNWVSAILSILVYCVLGYLGVRLGVRIKMDWSTSNWNRKHKERRTDAAVKILDTSVIIDGRIFDLCKCGFIEGTIVIPEFVLAELRHIADASDSLKRNRGRRGLDVLTRLQKELKMPVEISSVDYDDTSEVDLKLLKLAKEMDGKVVTNDYNLNKVASVQDVPVLNINELANAIKPVVLSGEEMEVTVVKDGKEYGQGVAYLDDGTMIVVEGGRGHMGEQLGVVVTSVLQTAAGRMIFTKIKDEAESA